MLRTISKYRRSFIGVAGVATIALVMTGFGLGGVIGGKKDVAIKVNDSNISHLEFYQKRRDMERRYRQMLGQSYEQFAGSLNLSQQLIDSLIAQGLLRQFAHEFGLELAYTPSGAVPQWLLATGLFPQGFDPATYRAYLDQMGMTAMQFENELQETAVQTQLVEFVQDLALVSNRELRTLVIRQETTYDLEYLEFDPAKYVDQVVDPGDSALQSYYDGVALDFELPPAVEYDYVLFDPKDFLGLVEILPEDIEVYYAEHERDYRTPEEIKARHIQINLPQGKDRDDPKKMAAVKDRAEKALVEVQAGGDFGKLAETYSDDFASRSNGGDLGWISRGKMGAEFDKAAFKLQGGGISDLVKTKDAYHIIEVVSFKPAGVKDLDDVRAQIEQQIRVEQAPLYTASKASEFFDRWSKSTSSLDEFALSDGLTANASSGLLSVPNDPPGAVGLTKRVLQNINENKQLIELGQRMAVVAVKQVREAEVPGLTEVRSKVVERYKKEHSKDVAKEKAQGLLESIKKGGAASLSQGAKSFNLELVKKAKARVGDGADLLGSKEAEQFVRSIQTESLKEAARPDRVIAHGDKFYLMSVTAVNPPTEQIINEKMGALRSSEQQAAGRAALQILINKFKAEAEIDIDQSLLIES